ncbi:MAG: hypothetical protein IKW83_07270 [Muribaculaceae bacterium]|nr:hypothetical protein [Muribaculaceae bacterium]
MNLETTNKNFTKAIIAISAIVMVIIVVLCCAFAYKQNKANDPNKSTLVRGASRNIKIAFRFKDDNDTHLEAGKKYGIMPVATRDDLDKIIGQLEKIESSSTFKIDSLTHSVPYLTPSAKDLLNIIGTNFQAKLKQKGLAQYRFLVTSLLRTNDDVNRLLQVNRNAVKQSSHLYGTTFDISYTRFEKVDSQPDFTGEVADHKVLVNILGETLKELRDANRCYVKYERGQPCYHITTRL